MGACRHGRECGFFLKQCGPEGTTRGWRRSLVLLIGFDCEFWQWRLEEQRRRTIAASSSPLSLSPSAETANVYCLFIYLIFEQKYLKSNPIYLRSKSHDSNFRYLKFFLSP